MSTERRFTELLAVATADVPAGHLASPLGAIRTRIRRRRTGFVVAALAATVVLTGGYSLGTRLLVEPAPHMPIGPPAETTAPAVPMVPWVSAMVARDDTTITVYAGAKRCEKLDRPQARIAVQDAGRITVEVTSRTIAADDCSSSGRAVPIVVKLPAPLGKRMLLDAVGGSFRPTYFQRYLPDFPAGSPWTPYDTEWDSDDPTWYAGYNGPGGASIGVRAQPTKSVHRDAPAGSVDIGPYHGTITGDGSHMWTVWWQAGGATYSLRLEPAEGASFTLTQFKHRLAQIWA